LPTGAASRRRIASFELICDLVEPGLDAGLVDPPANPTRRSRRITSSPTLIGSPPGIAMKFGKVTGWRTTGSLLANRLA
jgi:hypothetical protein